MISIHVIAKLFTAIKRNKRTIPVLIFLHKGELVYQNLHLNFAFYIKKILACGRHSIKMMSKAINLPTGYWPTWFAMTTQI